MLLLKNLNKAISNPNYKQFEIPNFTIEQYLTIFKPFRKNRDTSKMATFTNRSQLNLVFQKCAIKGSKTKKILLLNRAINRFLDQLEIINSFAIIDANNKMILKFFSLFMITEKHQKRLFYQKISNRIIFKTSTMHLQLFWDFTNNQHYEFYSSFWKKNVTKFSNRFVETEKQQQSPFLQ